MSDKVSTNVRFLTLNVFLDELLPITKLKVNEGLEALRQFRDRDWETYIR